MSDKRQYVFVNKKSVSFTNINNYCVNYCACCVTDNIQYNSREIAIQIYVRYINTHRCWYDFTLHAFCPFHIHWILYDGSLPAKSGHSQWDIRFPPISNNFVCVYTVFHISIPQVDVTVCQTDLMDIHSRGGPLMSVTSFPTDVDPAFRESGVQNFWLCFT